MWAVVPASVIGTSHEQLGTPCQDAHAYLRVKSGETELLLLAVADGAGSATHSQIGSTEAVRRFVEVAARSSLVIRDVTVEMARSWMREVLEHLRTRSEGEGVPVNELACTLLWGIVARNEAVFGQIGDGAWVMARDGVWGAVTWPQTGEYANVTTFLTSEGAIEAMQFERVESMICAVAGFTDGVQSLGLNLAARTAHQPFFEGLFSGIRECQDETELIAPLQSFLASEAVTSRTDDDKTLVLAWWREPRAMGDGISQ